MHSMTERFLKSTYLDKGTDISVSSLTKPDYQLWLTMHTPTMPKETHVGFKSAIGSAWHTYCEQQNEPGVVKEFSYTTQVDGTSIGGTADELVYIDDKWQIRDHKTKGVYSAKKFLGIGTKANPTPPPEQEKEILQLSIYRWLFKDMFDISDTAIIYLWVMGHTAREKFPEVSEVDLTLIPIKDTEKYIKSKLKIANKDKAPNVDCPEWLCDYCEMESMCPSRKHINTPFN